MSACARDGCSKDAPLDRWCSRKCCELAHGLSMAADVGHGGTDPQDITKMRTLGGVAPAVTRLQREAAARSLEAHARLVRESRSGRHARLGADQ